MVTILLRLQVVEQMGKLAFLKLLSFAFNEWLQLHDEVLTRLLHACSKLVEHVSCQSGFDRYIIALFPDLAQNLVSERLGVVIWGHM